MAQFNYKAQTPQGEITEGVVDAGSENQAISTLHGRGLVIISIEEGGTGGIAEKDIGAFLQRIGTKDVTIFTRQLATLVGAEVPLLESIKTLSRQTEKQKFADIIEDIARDVEGGSSLSQALDKYPDVFSIFYVRLVKSGELTGRLSETLNQLADFLERSGALVRKIRSALAYPAFVVFALVAVMTVMMTTVMPQLLNVLEESGVQNLPLTTRLMVSITDFFNQYILFILLGLVLGIIFFVRYVRSDTGREWFDAAKINLPRIQIISRAFYMARLSESLSTLVRVGIPILDALSLTSDLVGNEVYRKILLESMENVRGGGSISEVFAKYDEIPKLVPSMLAIGEKSGKTDFMLDNLAKFYKSEADNAVNTITQIIEPVLILFLGAAVGVVVSSILLPIFSLVGAA